ncbi:hypothetical protein QYM36_004160 [Artemia franciscana]|uniref:Eukaryotic translation initiation factor 3 subunit I n=2 Tax=Artemia franciscana TaxID=6661 RepID=A0AA88LFZ0_ARTSF|nr:hypothetical protein QYM36_004160 [Artemia franciscana]
MLHGHERSITQIKYNKDGDLLFSSAKDSSPGVWYSVNGERLGTYDGHTGVVWSLDVKWDTTQLLTGAGDNRLIQWDVETGKQLAELNNQTSVRTCQFSYSGTLALYSTDCQMGLPSEIIVIDCRDPSQIEQDKPSLRIPISAPNPKVTSILWGTLDEKIISGHENGDIVVWDFRTGKNITMVSEHSQQINDMQLSKDGTMFITASKDCTAKLFDTDSVDLMKTYKTERPVNSAALSPIHDHVVLGGGQEAMEVTTTSARVGKFDARFFHLVFEEEFGRVKGHFGPINSLAFHPDGKSYSSGGEDGYVRVHEFDQSYFDFRFDY